MATAKATTDHDEIRKWVEARKGRPARVKATGRGKDPGILRIDFPGFSGEDTLEEIEWDEFFEWFDKNNLALLLSGERGNRFNKLVTRPASARKSAGGGKKAGAKKAGGAKKASSRRVAASSSKKASSSKSSAKKAAASSSKKSSGSAKKASSASKKAAPAKKSSAKKSTTKSSSTTRRPVASKTPARKSSSKKSTSKKSAATGATRTTTDHDEIRKWVEARGGFPATVVGTETSDDEPGILRIDYPGYSGAGTLERIEWEDWFEKFDEEDLAFLYQNKRNSRFSKLVRR